MARAASPLAVPAYVRLTHGVFSTSGKRTAPRDGGHITALDVFHVRKVANRAACPYPDQAHAPKLFTRLPDQLRAGARASYSRLATGRISCPSASDDRSRQRRQINQCIVACSVFVDEWSNGRPGPPTSHRIEDFNRLADSVTSIPRTLACRRAYSPPLRSPHRIHLGLACAITCPIRQGGLNSPAISLSCLPCCRTVDRDAAQYRSKHTLPIMAMGFVSFLAAVSTPPPPAPPKSMMTVQLSRTDPGLLPAARHAHFFTPAPAPQLTPFFQLPSTASQLRMIRMFSGSFTKSRASDRLATQRESISLCTAGTSDPAIAL